MASKRCFARNVIESDEFYELSTEAKLLYFLAAMQCNDYGEFTTARTICRTNGLDPACLDELLEAGVIIPVWRNVYVFRDWWVHNAGMTRFERLIDRVPSEFADIGVDQNGVYHLWNESDVIEIATVNHFLNWQKETNSRTVGIEKRAFSVFAEMSRFERKQALSDSCPTVVRQLSDSCPPNLTNLTNPTNLINLTNPTNGKEELQRGKTDISVPSDNELGEFCIPRGIVVPYSEIKLTIVTARQSGNAEPWQEIVRRYYKATKE